jgi:hypothetical protein
MRTLDLLSTNKGTVSSALSKTLARQVLEGQTSILMDCIDLATFELSKPAQRHVRSGASKVVEIVAEVRPDWVAPYLDKLLPALSAKEPQTRWTVIRTMGFCAHLNRPVARRAIEYAEKYIGAKEGLAIASSADLFLGDFGAISKQDAHLVFPILKRSMAHAITNEQDWLLEALCKVFPNLNKAEQETAVAFSKKWQRSPRQSTRQRAERILRMAK